MQKINIGNTEILENGGLKLMRKINTGVVITLCLGIGLGILNEVLLHQKYNQVITSFVPADTVQSTASWKRDQIFIDDDEVMIPYEQKSPINVSLEQINSMNIIINDNDCREDFINGVCEELERDGIKFRFSTRNSNIEMENAVVITLDQQYMAGPASVIFAPLKNEDSGNSDALALAAQKAFYEKGFLVDSIACGQMGFRENDNGSVSERIPTDTETAISSNKNISFVTISFGTQNTNAKLTAAGIEAMLTRYYSYINNDYGEEDLIYCAQSGQTYKDIADILGTSEQRLTEYNMVSDESILLAGQAIINPIAASRPEFDKQVPTNLYIDKTLWSK